MKDALVGIQEIESIPIQCGDCGLPLAEVVLTETNETRLSRGFFPLRSEFQVIDCPKCSGKSFKTRVLEGTTVVGAIKEGYALESVDADILEDNTISSVLRIRKL
jgi:hypothetical protein